jgi:glycerol-3-phosphate acyltransferase PlsY
MFICVQSLIQPIPDMLPIFVSSVVGAGLIVFAHRANIERLREKTENKF